MEHISDSLKKIERQQTTSAAPAPSEEQFKCAICRDIGCIHPLRPDDSVDYGQVLPCSCALERLAIQRPQRLLEHCRLPEKSEGKTFLTFEERSDACRAAKELAVRMAHADDEVIFLTLMTDTGLGKSHLAIAICREWIAAGRSALYCYVPAMLDDIRDSYRKDDTTGQSHSQLLDTLGKVGLLVLDDLGTEKKSDWACETLQSIIDNRARNTLPLVVTTNKSLDELPNDGEGRIASRLKRESWCKIAVF